MGWKGVARVSAILVVCIAGAQQCFISMLHHSDEILSSTAYGLLALIFSALTIVCIDIVRMNPADSFNWCSMIDHYRWYTGLTIRGWWNYHLIEKKSKNVRQLLHENLMNIVNKNKDTDYGRDKGVDKVKTPEDFKNVPFGSWETMKDYIERAAEGDVKAITNDPTKHLVYTSGTTGGRKYWPFSKSVAIAQHEAIKEYNVTRRVGRSMGRTVMLFHPTNPDKVDPSKPVIQTMSSIVYTHRPFWTNPWVVFEIQKENDFMYCSAVFGLRDREVDSMKTVFAGMMFTFWVIVGNNWKQICDNIENGYINKGTINAQVDDETLAKINSYLTPEPERAQQLREEFAKGMHGIARRVWPRILYVDMITTGALGHPAKLLRENQLYGIPLLSLHITASEGIIGYNTDNDLFPTKYTLFPLRQYFEWVPAVNVGETNPKTVETDELIVGESYELVVTTYCGLTRNRTGDILTCVGKKNQLPVFTFSYRSGQLLDLTGEKMTEKDFYDIVLLTCKELNVQLIDYTCSSNRSMRKVAEYTKDHTNVNNISAHYVLFVEIQRNGKTVLLTKEEKDKFDENLRLNYELYSVKREEKGLETMEVIETQKDSFQKLKELMIKDTQNEQFKMPRVLNKQIFLEFLMTQTAASEIEE